jgi:hypothetical protein
MTDSRACLDVPVPVPVLISLNCSDGLEARRAVRGRIFRLVCVAVAGHPPALDGPFTATHREGGTHHDQRIDPRLAGTMRSTPRAPPIAPPVSVVAPVKRRKNGTMA